MPGEEHGNTPWYLRQAGRQSMGWQGAWRVTQPQIPTNYRRRNWQLENIKVRHRNLAFDEIKNWLLWTLSNLTLLLCNEILCLILGLEADFHVIKFIISPAEVFGFAEEKSRLFCLWQNKPILDKEEKRNILYTLHISLWFNSFTFDLCQFQLRLLILP